MGADIIQAREAVLQSTLMMADIVQTQIGIFLTILFAYIVVGYAAGAKLSRLQLGLTTGMFVIAAAWQLMCIVLMQMSMNVKLAHLAEFSHKITEVPVAGNELAPLLVAGIWGIGVVIALVFMWTVRRTKIE